MIASDTPEDLPENRSRSWIRPARLSLPGLEPGAGGEPAREARLARLGRVVRQGLRSVLSARPAAGWP
jgi:hypothetical protein